MTPRLPVKCRPLRTAVTQTNRLGRVSDVVHESAADSFQADEGKAAAADIADGDGLRFRAFVVAAQIECCGGAFGIEQRRYLRCNHLLELVAAVIEQRAAVAVKGRMNVSTGMRSVRVPVAPGALIRASN